VPDVSEFVAHWGYLAIFVIVVRGNVGLPVPEESALLARGYLVWRGDLMCSGVLTVGIVGAVAGDNVGYWIRAPVRATRTRPPAALGRDHAATASIDAKVLGALGLLGGVCRPVHPWASLPRRPVGGDRGAPLHGLHCRQRALGAVVYMPVIVAAGYAVGYGVGPHVERILRTLGPVEYVVLTVTVVAAGTFFLWRAIRACRENTLSYLLFLRALRAAR
jgi:hypothetical protein